MIVHVRYGPRSQLGTRFGGSLITMSATPLGARPRQPSLDLSVMTRSARPGRLECLSRHFGQGRVGFQKRRTGGLADLRVRPPRRPRGGQGRRFVTARMLYLIFVRLAYGYQDVTVKTTAGPVALARPKLRGIAEASASRLFGAHVIKTKCAGYAWNPAGVASPSPHPPMDVPEPAGSAVDRQGDPRPVLRLAGGDLVRCRGGARIA